MRSDASGHKAPDDVHVAGAMLEAYLVHLRVLDDFLGKAEPRKEDVLAVDFCPEYAPRYPLDPEQRQDIDRRVAHLTLRRTDDFQWGKRRPYTTAVFNELRVFMRVLREHHEQRAAWIQPMVTASRRFLRESVGGWPQPRSG